MLCRRCCPRGDSSPRAAEENTDVQSESNVDNSDSASAVKAVVQAGTLTLAETRPGPEENVEAA